MEKNKLLEKIRLSLNSGKSTEIEDALNTINELSLHEFIPDITNVFSSSSDANIRQIITTMFNDIKHTRAVPLIVSAIKAEKNNETLMMLVSAAWQCGLDFSGYIDCFVPVLLSDDFTLAFEAYTVIENNIDYMDKAKAESLRSLLETSRDKMPEKIVLLYEGLIEQLESIS